MAACGFVMIMLVVALSSTARLFATENASSPSKAEQGKHMPSPSGDPLANVIIERIQFREATLSEAADFFRFKAREKGADTFNLVIVKMPLPEPKITLSLSNIPIAEAIRYLAEKSGLKLRREANAFVLSE